MPPIRSRRPGHVAPIPRILKLTLIFFALVLASCAKPLLPPGGIAALDGIWRGEAVRRVGLPDCPTVTPYVMTVREGAVTGEIRQARNPDVVIDRFQAFIEYDGALYARARPGGEDIDIFGRFLANRFEGETKSRSCTNRITLTRQPE
ncbi:MAG: hypothetical protein HY057_02805 [Rhodospirillales bacterium]|nr:hypothetical protein [Rhodospirillales bacterium]